MSNTTIAKPEDRQARIRATAVRHALIIEDKKMMANRVTDLILQAYDIPTNVNADPAMPCAGDLAIARECLAMFRPSDLDELTTEKNIDDRCGYILCSKPHRKIPGAGNKVWNRRGGKDFRLLNTADVEKWCSDECSERNAFVRAQLSPEPAWTRDTQNNVKLLDEIKSAQAVETLTDATKALSLGHAQEVEAMHKLAELSLERGEDRVQDVSDQVSIQEKETTTMPARAPTLGASNAIEGHVLRRVRFDK